MGSAPRPAARRRPHDTWSRRWGTLLGVLLLVGSFLPVVAPDRSSPMDGNRMRGGTMTITRPLVWPWDAAWGRLPAGLSLFWIPLLAGATAIVASGRFRATARARTLCAAATVATASAAVSSVTSDAWGYTSPPETCAYFGLVAAALAVAAGNHVRRSFPTSEAARSLAALGGAALLACLLVPCFDGRAAVSALFVAKEWKSEPVACIAVLWLLAYALLGVASLGRGSWTARRSIALTVFGFAFLALASFGLLHGLLSGPREGLAKTMLVCLVPPLLMAVGVAMWIEAILSPRPSDDVDAGALEDVFR